MSELLSLDQYSFYNFYLVIEELLIDFRELIGEHSGENMAEAVWETLKRYGLEKRARTFRTSLITCQY